MNDPTATTRITLSKTDASDLSQGPNLLGLKVGDHIVVRPVSNVASWRSFIITAARVDNAAPAPGWVDLTVVLNQAAETLIIPANNDPVMFDFLRFTPSPLSVGDVADVVVDDLHIPRIEDTEVIEQSTDEIQVVTPSGTITGGTFRLTLLTLQTADIAWDATAAAIKTALNTAIPDNTITVTGGPLPTAPITLTVRRLRPRRPGHRAGQPHGGGGDADAIDHHRRSLQHLRRSRDDRGRAHPRRSVGHRPRWPRQHLVSSHG